jgi:hypothetical protein
MGGGQWNASGWWQVLGAHLNFGNEMPREALTRVGKKLITSVGVLAAHGSYLTFVSVQARS